MNNQVAVQTKESIQKEVTTLEWILGWMKSGDYADAMVFVETMLKAKQATVKQLAC